MRSVGKNAVCCGGRPVMPTGVQAAEASTRVRGAAQPSHPAKVGSGIASCGTTKGTCNEPARGAERSESRTSGSAGGLGASTRLLAARAWRISKVTSAALSTVSASDARSSASSERECIVGGIV